MQEEILLKLLSELGFPIMITLVSVYIAFISLKLILADVLILIKKIRELIQSIDTKVKNIENDISILDILITSAMGVKIDLTQFTNKITKNQIDRDNDES